MTDFCVDCPDREACATGYSCEYVKATNPTPVVIDITRTSHVPDLIVGGVVYEGEEGL